MNGFKMKKLKLKPLLESMVTVNNLINALKTDDKQATNKALFNLIQAATGKAKPEQELGIGTAEFKALANSVRSGDLNKARMILGIEKGKSSLDTTEEPVDTNKINPFTGRPWPSGPVNQPGKKLTINDFKVGQKVRLVKDSIMQQEPTSMAKIFKVGEQGVIVEIDQKDKYVAVEFINSGWTAPFRETNPNNRFFKFRSLDELEIIS